MGLPHGHQLRVRERRRGCLLLREPRHEQRRRPRGHPHRRPPPGRKLRRAGLQLLSRPRRHGDRHRRLLLHEHGKRVAGPAQRHRPRARARPGHQPRLPHQPDEADGALLQRLVRRPPARRHFGGAARLRRLPRERRHRGHRHRLRNARQRHRQLQRREPRRQRGQRLLPLHGPRRQAAGRDPDARRLQLQPGPPEPDGRVVPGRHALQLARLERRGRRGARAQRHHRAGDGEQPAGWPGRGRSPRST